MDLFDFSGFFGFFSFFGSWPLFFRSYMLTLIAAAVLALVGIVANARRQLFMAAAVSQTSLLGYGILGLASMHVDGVVEICCEISVLGLVIVSAFFTMLGRNRHGAIGGGRLDGDERTAWVFVGAGSLTVLILTHAPSGMEHIRRLQVSSVVGATWMDLLLFTLLLLVIIAALCFFMRTLVLLLSDQVMAAAIGIKLSHWNVALAILSGLSVGLAVRSTGALFTFGALAIPCMIAKQICGEVRGIFILAPILGSGLSFLGLWFGHYWNLPPAQSAVGMMCFGLLVTHMGRLMLNRLGA